MIRSINRRGFTLIELLIVIAIIGVLFTFAFIALGNARMKSRDAKRVADIQQISKALELYYDDYGYYPTLITPGQPLTSSDGSKVYIATIPNNPSPQNDNGCGNNNYTYAATPNNNDYSLNFCLGTNIGSLASGINSTSGSAGLGSAPGLIGWWKFNEGSGTTAYDYSGNNNVVIGGIAPSWILGSPCRVDKCLRISDGRSGLASNVYTPSSPILNISGAMTILGWIYAYGPDENGNSTMVIVNKSGAYYFAGSDWGLKCVFGWNNYSHAPNLSYNNWYHIAATITDSGTISYYINGVLVSPTIFRTMPLTTNSNAVFFGSRDAYKLNGMLSDVRIYNRSLSAEEINALYNAEK